MSRVTHNPARFRGFNLAGGYRIWQPATGDVPIAAGPSELACLLRRHYHWHRTGRPAPAARLAASGRKVAIVERKLFGGTCVNTGCIPIKTLVASAYVARMAQRAADY